MKIPSYTQTVGLERYPQGERFAIHRATHKRLMSEDAAYRRRWSSYVAGIVCVAVMPASSFMVSGVAGILLLILSVAGVVAGVVYLAFRQQQFMNERIGDVLRR